MDWTWYLRFCGHINRAKFWLAMPIMVCWVILLRFLGRAARARLDVTSAFDASINDVFAVIDAASHRRPTAPISCRRGCLPSKRRCSYGSMPPFRSSVLHERDRSGRWIALSFLVARLIAPFDDRLGDSIAATVPGLVAVLRGLRGFIATAWPARQPQRDQPIWREPAAPAAVEAAQRANEPSGLLQLAPARRARNDGAAR